MDFNKDNRENPLAKYTPNSNVKDRMQKVVAQRKVWWEENKSEPEKKDLSLAAKILKEEKLQKDICIDTAIKEHNPEFSETGQIMLKYMEKYLKKDMPLFEKMKEIENNPNIRDEFSEYEWALLVQQAWVMSYRKAMDDEYITLEERHELNNLYSLGKKHKAHLFYQPQLKQKILDSFKVLATIDRKYANENKYNDGELWMKQYDSVPRQTKHYRRLPNPNPKLTPYSDGKHGYRW